MGCFPGARRVASYYSPCLRLCYSDLSGQFLEAWPSWPRPFIALAIYPRKLSRRLVFSNESAVFRLCLIPRPGRGNQMPPQSPEVTLVSVQITRVKKGGQNSVCQRRQARCPGLSLIESSAQLPYYSLKVSLFPSLPSLRFRAHPSLFTCRARAIPRDSSGTSSQIEEPAAT